MLCFFCISGDLDSPAEDPLKTPEHPSYVATATGLGKIDNCNACKALFDCVDDMGRSNDRQADGGFISSTNEGQWTPYAWSSCSSVEPSEFPF